ncbi:hypothetical protein [Treponema pedis]|nr:hypothetical protein [Treponema pedis]
MDIDPSKKMTIGANEISEKIDALNNREFLKEALEILDKIVINLLILGI